MKKQIFLLLLIAATIIGCKSSPPDVEEDWMDSSSSQRSETSGNESNTTNVSSIEGHEWKLIEVYVDGKNIGFSRSTLPAEPGNLFTLNFDAQNISGVGVPNRYSAPFTMSGNTINIMLIRATLMASFFEPEKINERDFFDYLQNTTSWKLANKNLELLSKTKDGKEVRLLFSL